jgi:3-phosphoglycerate kinase
VENSDNFDVMTNIFEQIISKLPGKAVNNMQKEITILRELVMDQRQPCLMIIGRRGAEKVHYLMQFLAKK